MPIHLSAISRRRFLARSLAAGAGLVLAPELLAASRRTDSHSWALLSDTHLAADGALEVRGIKMAEHSARVARDVLELPRRPAALLVTGDCAYNSGQAGDYARMIEALAPIRADKIPVHIALGNHDDRDAFWDALPAEKAAAKVVQGRQVSLIRAPRANWFILDSLEKTLSTPGLLGPEQLQWLAEALDANRKKPALVVAHHNPGLNGGNMGLKDTLLLLEVIRPRTQVKAFIYGHTHTWKLEQDSSGIHLINLPAVSYVFREGEPAGWVLATLQRKGLHLELRCVNHAHKLHGQSIDLKWRQSA